VQDSNAGNQTHPKWSCGHPTWSAGRGHANPVAAFGRSGTQTFGCHVIGAFLVGARELPLAEGRGGVVASEASDVGSEGE
jgi:hypothetical protein